MIATMTTTGTAGTDDNESERGPLAAGVHCILHLRFMVWYGALLVLFLPSLDVL